MFDIIEDIWSLKGIGFYMVGVIGSIVFNFCELVIDGNVMWVVSCLFEIDVDIVKVSSCKVFEVVMFKIIDCECLGDFN